MALSSDHLDYEAESNRSMAQYPLDNGYMPLPEYFQQSPQSPYSEYYQPIYNPPHQYEWHDPQHPTYQSYEYADQRSLTPPPRPPKEPIVEMSIPDPSPTRVESDVLPPTTRPHVSTPIQSEPRSNSRPIQSVRIGKEEVWNPETGYASFVIAREAAHMPSFLSTKPLVNVTRASDGSTIGTIRFHSVTTSNIDLTINGRSTCLEHSGVIHNRWGFQPTTTPNVDEKWYWKKDKDYGGAKLEDARKNGTALARMKGDLLTFEFAALNDAICDEILVSALAMVEAARRQSKDGNVTDLGVAIGDFVSSDESQ